nr:MAG TPA: hypothetical protein [Caudoviricetes sp.]
MLYLSVLLDTLSKYLQKRIHLVVVEEVEVGEAQLQYPLLYQMKLKLLNQKLKKYRRL